MTEGRTGFDERQAELARLIETLDETQRRILHLTEGHADAVIPASGALLLLPQTGVHFREQIDAHRLFAAERNAILDALPVHVALLGADGEIRVINAAWRAYGAMLGLRPGYQVGDVYLDFWHSKSAAGHPEAEAVIAAVGAVLRGEQRGFEREYRLDSLPSRPWFQLVVAPLAEEGARGAIVMHVDITDRIRAEERQRDSEERMRRIERLDALGQLTGGVAHDFNNLLTVILGNAEILEVSLPEGDTRRDWAELIRVAAEKSAALTNRLLAFARRQSLDPRPIDVMTLLGGMSMLLNHLIDERITVRMNGSAMPLQVLADPSGLENAILNLCLNARDAMPNGGTLTIEAGPLDLGPDDPAVSPELAAGRYVAVTVSDTGEGMDEATMARVFEPFFTTKEGSKGSGLGLSTVYGFFKQSRGAVTIASKPGLGTQVRLWLPRLEAAAAQAPVSVDRLRMGAGQHILLAEDDPLVGRHVLYQIESLGYRVTVVSNGVEALALLDRGENVDLMLTDIVMPGCMDGFELLRRARERRPELPVILTSGYADALDEATKAALGETFLPKPFRRAVLASKIAAVLAARDT